MTELAHVVFYVHSLEPPLQFYRDVVELELVGKGRKPRATNEVELFVDDPRIDWRSSTDWLQDPAKPLRL